MVVRVGQQFGNYRLFHLLGTGGFAEVYLGEHIHLGTQAAIKVLHSQLQHEDGENFRMEARKIAHLAHSHIVRVLDFGVESRTPFLVMDYAPHGTLRQLHTIGVPLPFNTLISYVKQIASALQYVHAQNLIHRDIKPENMLVGQNNQVLLSDFGIAVIAHNTGTQKTQDVTGTGAYMAPEQIKGKPRPASDQYALGVVVYEWLSGTRPFEGTFTEVCSQHLLVAPPSLRERNPTLSLEIEQVVLKALSKEPHFRFANIQAFADALEQASIPKKIQTTVPIQPLQSKQQPIVLAPPSLPVSTPQTITNKIQQAENKQECFLCMLDPRHPCIEKKLAGRIVNAYERNVNGEMLPFIVTTSNTGNPLVSIALTRYYRSLVKELIELGKDGIHKHKLNLRVYHLPTAPTVSEYKGQPLHHYTANAYTLAVLEPDILLNITELNQGEYCSRQYLLKRLIDSPPSAATIRGNLIHYCFKELLKEHDRGKLMHGHGSKGQETPLATLQHHFEEALKQNTIELALANVSVQAMRDDVLSHLESLASWFQNQSSTLWDMPAIYREGQTEEASKHQSGNKVRAETFLLAPEIGLRGRLDLFWQQSGRQRLLELKTGGIKGDLPKQEHRWQVKGYHALLTVRRNSTMTKAMATLLYSGTPGEAHAVGIPFSDKELQRVNEKRNILMLSHITGRPAAPPGPSRCTKCAMLQQCTQVSSLLDWKPPEPDTSVQSQYGDVQPLGMSMVQPSAVQALLPQAYTAEQRNFFTRFYHLLNLEGSAGEKQLALLWQEDIKARSKRGVVINVLQLDKTEPTGQGEWIQTFKCENKSELREGDEILLSDGNPITGEVGTGTIIKISATEVQVWTPELLSHPRLIDRYDNDIVHVRTLKNLLRWLQADAHLQDLVSGKVRPQFKATSFSPRKDFNAQQNLAVERALQMQDYLLVQGPPGTGKTSVIAEIVKRLCKQGQRVMLAAFTNQAVDNMLKRLDAEDFEDYLRLGHERSVDAKVAGRLLNKLVESPDAQQVSIHEILLQRSVVASTTAMWSSEKYTPPSPSETAGSTDSIALQFDVAIIDEASQLTVPAILGALRFAKRFILVGDEKQLPPLILSKETTENELAISLFEYLKRQDNNYMKEPEDAVGACVSLQRQYRMNKWISHFASQVFYEGKLEAAPQVANRILDITPQKRPTTEIASITQAIHPLYPLVFLNVRGEPDRGESKTSDTEARAVRDVVKGLLVQGIKEKDIGLMAPFRAQVANLRHHLFRDDTASGWSALKPETPMSVDTVDRFQGGERMVIIMSFAISQTPGIESPLRDFLTNPNRLNVALTRAQRKLIVVGCASALEGLPYFDRLLKYCRSMGTVISYSEA
ncbi:MAG: hypothetical protein NVS4B7_08590 [Ktedonobacteraceae bacterium]